MIRSHLVAAIATVFITAQANAADLTFVSWGGAWQQAQEDTALKPFGTKFKVNTKADTYNGGIAQLRSQVQTGNVTWDVVDVQLADAIRACDEGLLEKINPAVDLAPGKDGKSVQDDFLPKSVSECLAGNIIWSTVIAYNKTKVGGGVPSTISDFFDLKKFPGKRGLRKAPDGAMEWALLADGVKPADVYNVLGTAAGVNRAFKKLDTIKSSIIWWETGAQPPQLLADGEVVMSSAYNGRIYSAMISDKKPFDILWDGQLQNIEGYAIVKGSKNLAQAKSFIRYATESEQLAALAPLTAYGPARRSAIALVDQKVVPFLPTTPKNMTGAVMVDSNFWADHADDLNQKFAAWLGRK